MRWIGALFFVAALAIWPGVALEAARGAMEAWATSVAPALFPFVAAIPALTCPEARMAYEKWLGKAMRALFRVPASASGAIVIGFLAGSPAGATALKQTMAGETYTRAEALRAAALISGCSPMFLVGGVGTAMLGSHAAGLALMGAQLGALILGGLFLRFWPLREESAPRPRAGDWLHFGRVRQHGGVFRGRGAAHAISFRRAPGGGADGGGTGDGHAGGKRCRPSFAFARRARGFHGRLHRVAERRCFARLRHRNARAFAYETVARAVLFRPVPAGIRHSRASAGGFRARAAARHRTFAQFCRGFNASCAGNWRKFVV